MSTNTPCHEQAGLDKEPQTKLRAAGTLEKELLELLPVQVAVLIESHEDGDVSSGQSPEKRFIRNLVSSHRSGVLKRQEAVWTMDLREQSRGQNRRI